MSPTGVNQSEAVIHSSGVRASGVQASAVIEDLLESVRVFGVKALR